MSRKPFVMSRKAIAILFSSFLLLLVASQSLRAQSSEWQTFSPEGEEFSISMPKDPKFEEGPTTYHRMILNTRLYLSQPANGPVLAVASLSGIKANSNMYTEFERLNSYADAFKGWFPEKVAGKDAIAKMIMVGDKTLNGNKGREYSISIGKLSGTAHMFATRRRFYAIVILNSKKDDALTEKFLSSLTLPEKISAPAATAMTEKPAVGDGAGATKPAKTDTDEAQKPGATGVTSTEPKPAEAAGEKPPTGTEGVINGGVLNGKALYLPAPEYPPIAAQAKAGGTVTVQVLIDEVGNVVSARAVSGHPLLQATSVAAARQARFSPTSLSGVPVKVSGFLTFNFVAP
jgi:TonB family protein